MPGLAAHLQLYYATGIGYRKRDAVARAHTIQNKSRRRYFLFISKRNELGLYAVVRRASSVRPSVNIGASRFFSQTNGWIVNKLLH